MLDYTKKEMQKHVSELKEVFIAHYGEANFPMELFMKVHDLIKDFGLKVMAVIEFKMSETDETMSDPTKRVSGYVWTPGQNDLVWTGTKSGLTELIYALKDMKCFNHGNASMDHISRHLQHTLCVKIPNISRSYNEIVHRKTGDSLFLDSLVRSFNGQVQATLDKMARK